MDWVLLFLFLVAVVAVAVLKIIRRQGSVESRVKVSREKTLKRRRKKKKKLRRKQSAFLLDRQSEVHQRDQIASSSDSGALLDDTFDEVIFQESPEAPPSRPQTPVQTHGHAEDDARLAERVSDAMEAIFAETEEEEEEEEDDDEFIATPQVINMDGYQALDEHPNHTMPDTPGYQSLPGAAAASTGEQYTKLNGSYYVEAYRGGDGYVFRTEESVSMPAITEVCGGRSATLQRTLLSSSAEAPVRRGQAVGWNSMFQQLLELPEDGQAQKLNKYQALSALAEDFVCVAQQSGRTIISEAFLPPHCRTIQPMELGGQAGGEKYVHNGMLFKFATDWKNLYGGDAYAMKAAGHELKGLMRYYLCDGLNVPLMALVDYKGFRLVAQSILPISSDTLVYGSSDSGRTVLTSNSQFNKKMEKAGQRLHLKGHLTKSGAIVYGPTDIEGHIGTDGRHYVIDLARVFPPTCADDSVKRTFLYQLMRPEFVARSQVHLNSDAWSGFSSFSEKHPDNVEVKEQTHRLLDVVLPEFCEWLEKEGPPASLTEHLHRRGINCRYYGLVRQRLKDARLRKIVASEVLARAAKNLLHSNFRSIARSIVIPGDSVYKREIARVITALTSADPIMWSGLRSRALTSFPGCIGVDEQVFDIVEMPMLLRRLLQLTGIVLGKRAWEELKQNWQGFVVVVSDVINVGGKVKHMNVVAYSDAMSLYLQSKNSSSVSNAARLFSACEARFDRAIEAVPDSLATLKQYGDVLVAHGCSRTSLGDSLYYFRKALDKRREARDIAGIYELGITVLANVGAHWQYQKEMLLLAEECFHMVIRSKGNSDARLGLSQALRTRSLLIGDKKLMSLSGTQLRKAVHEKVPRVPKFAQYLSDNSSAAFAELYEEYSEKSRIDMRTLMSSPTDKEWEKLLRSAKPRQLAVTRDRVLHVVADLPFWRGLTHLDIVGPISGLSDRFLAKVLSGGINLLSLGFSRLKCVGNQTVTAIAEHHAALRTLKFEYCKGLALLNSPPIHMLLKNCASLQTLSLRGTPMPASRYRMFAEGFPLLTGLDMRECRQASHLPGQPGRLLSLHIDFCVYSIGENLTQLTTHHASDDLCLMISKLCSPKLRRLALPDSHLSDDAVVAVVQNAMLLEELSLSNCTEITDAVLVAVSTCQHLAKLNLSACRFITASGIENVASGCHSLTHLDTSSCILVGDISLVFKRRWLPLLQEVNFDGCVYLTGSSVTSMIRSCPRLLRIRLAGCKYVKDKAVSMMTRLQLLRLVALSGVKASDAALKSLAGANKTLEIIR